MAPMHRLLYRRSGPEIRVHRSLERLRSRPSFDISLSDSPTKQGGRQRSSLSAESHRSHESNSQVNQTNDLASGVRTEEAVPKSRPTDYIPLAATDPQPEPLSESREPITLSSKAASSGFGAEDAIVLIMGPAGSGKSSFISKATGNVGEGVGHDLLAGSYTKEVRATKCMIDGIPIILVDIPALDGATSDVVILSMVSKWLDKTKKSKAHISAVLLFHPIADNRMRWMPWDLFYRCREWCGGELASRTRIDLVTTMWDEADEEIGNERLAELEGNHWKPMLESGSTILRYQNTPESAMELLRAVISKKPDQIQPAGAFLPTGPGGIRDHVALSQTPATIGERSVFGPNDVVLQPPQKANHEAHEVQLSELSTQDMLILIIGPVGCGKSSFIGKAVGNEEGIGHSLCTGSHTREIRATRCTIGNFVNAVLLDTPGFDNTSISEKQILDMVSKSLEEVHNGRIFLSAILLLHPITDNRLRWTPLKYLRLFQKLCGKEAMAQTGLVTTMWDEVDEDVGNERMTALNSNYWRAMIAQGSKTYRLLNTRDAAGELLREVISKSEERYHSMLKQEISGLKTHKETVAAQMLCSRLEQLSERRLEIMRELRPEEGGAVDQKTEGALRREYAEVGVELDVTLNQVQVLKRSPTLPPLRRLFNLKASRS